MSNMSEGIGLNLESNPTEYNRRLVLYADHLYAIGGENGTITATSLSDPSSFRVVQQYDEPVRALAFSADGLRVAVGYEDGNVDIYSFTSDQLGGGTHPFLGNNGSNDTTSKSQDAFDDFFSQDNGDLFGTSEKLAPTFRLGFRFEASIRSLAFDPRCKNGKYFLAISSEATPGFMVVDASNEESFQKFFASEAEKEYNQGGVRSLQYSPDGNIITSIGLDGKLCFWSVEGSDPELEWELIHSDSHKVVSKPDLGQFADSADRSCYPVWNVDGSILALPGDKDLQLRRKGNSDIDWMKKDCIVLAPSNDESHSEIVAIAFDPRNEGYVVTSTRDGNVGLWKLTDESSRNIETPEGEFVASIASNESLCTSLLWTRDSEENDVLYLALASGKLITVKKRESIIPAVKKDGAGTEVREKENELPEENEMSFDEETTADSNRNIRLHKNKNQDENDTDDELGEESSKKKNPFVADEADEDDFDDTEKAADNFDDVIASTENSGKDDFDTPGEMSQNNQDGDQDFDVDDFDNDEDGEPAQSSIPEAQPPFAPSSTPWGARRILCWNSVGVITSIERDGIEGSYRTIDISFTDSVSNRPVSFKDNFDFIVGTLGEEGALFASDLIDGENDLDESGIRKVGKMKDTGSHIYYHRFNTFGSVKDKDWYIALPVGERAVGCATGIGWNAIVTNRQFMRFFSASGNQGPVVCIKGDPVTIVGGGRFAAVFYHECNPLLDGTQRLGYTIFDGITGAQINEGSVSAISKGHSLHWAGFDDHQSLCVMDSDGILSMLFSCGSGSPSMSWMPILDTATLKKSASDTFWPVSVQDGKLVCVPLKGVDAHPDVIRRPLTTSLSAKMPLARGGGGKNVVMDEVSLRSNLVLKNKKFVDDYLVANGAVTSDDIAEIEQEYGAMCANVDKVTLKLLFTFTQEGKVEKAFDLAHRLNLEQSFQIAITASERCNQRKLADRISDLMESRFHEEEEEEEEDQNGYQEDDASQNTEELDTTYRSITPLQADLKRKEREVAFNDAEEAGEDEKNTRRRLNPFAIKQKESPAKNLLSSPVAAKKPLLSRQSTFSANSRMKAKQSKHLL